MADKWPVLGKPPVIVALFQLQFEMGNLVLNDFLKFDSQLRKDFPKRADNIEASINMPSTAIPLGISKVIGTSNARMQSHVYFTEDQKCKLTISEGSITYVDEHPYVGWPFFQESVCKYIALFAPVLETHTINRTSIRFINQFAFESFDNPTEYFNTLISSTEDKGFPFPLIKYGFKLVLDIRQDIYSIVNQNLEKSSANYNYIFDIDVLNKSNLIFDVNSIVDVLSELRGIKNSIFFSNVTQKTIDLCN
jgi:hypothetical protein